MHQSAVNTKLVPLQATLKIIPGTQLVSKVVTSLSNAYLIVDDKWNVLYWNEKASAISGISEEQIIGKNLWQSIAAVLPVSLYENYYDKLIRDIPSYVRIYCSELNAWISFNTWYHQQYLYISISEQCDDENFCPPVLTTYNSSSQLYKLVTEITNDCLWDLDPGTKQIFWIDGGHQRVFGYPIKNILVPKYFWEDCIHPDDRERVLSSFNKVFKESGPELWECEYQFKKADGHYIYVHDRGRIFYDEQQRVIRIVGATQDIHQRKLLEQKLAEEILTRQHEITGSVLVAQEKERTHIGEELHDNLGQLLAATKMYIQQSKTSDENRDAYLDKAIGFIVTVMNEIRRISRALVIPPATIIALPDNIRMLVHDINLLHPVKIVFKHNLTEENELPEKLQINIFRIVQEQLSNIVRHSEATHAEVTITGNKKAVSLLIADNGKGKDDESPSNDAGLINIRSRVECHKGELIIVSKKEEGFRLTAVFPLD